MAVPRGMKFHPLASRSSVTPFRCSHSSHPSAVPDVQTPAPTSACSPTAAPTQSSNLHEGPVDGLSDEMIYHPEALDSSASIARIFLSRGQPNARLRSALSNRATPITIVLAAAYSVSIITSTVRTWMIERTRNCKDCKGYGIRRCELCDGAGTISWEGKWGHVEPCPRCIGKRYNRCESCGGYHVPTLFAHVTRNPVDVQQSLEPVTVADQLTTVKRELVMD
eukprot:jgi/Ulvmu1/5689/UM024_0036.1